VSDERSISPEKLLKSAQTLRWEVGGNVHEALTEAIYTDAASIADVFWITITGANVPSAWLASLLIGKGHPWLSEIALSLGFPLWLKGLLIDGMYLATAWVISVMLPPMAIFFPLFTLSHTANRRSV